MRDYFTEDDLGDFVTDEDVVDAGVAQSFGETF